MSEYEPYQQRVVVEHEELAEKLDKLAQFLQTPQFASVPKDEASRLVSQADIMGQYEAILVERIEAFNGKTNGT